MGAAVRPRPCFLLAWASGPLPLSAGCPRLSPPARGNQPALTHVPLLVTSELPASLSPKPKAEPPPSRNAPNTILRSVPPSSPIPHPLAQISLAASFPVEQFCCPQATDSDPCPPSAPSTTPTRAVMCQESAQTCPGPTCPFSFHSHCPQSQPLCPQRCSKPPSSDPRAGALSPILPWEAGTDSTVSTSTLFPRPNTM